MSHDLEPRDLVSLVDFFNAGRHAELEIRSRALLEQHPHSGFVWKALGAALSAQGKEALPALRKAAELLDRDAEVHYNLGAVLQGLGQLDEAVHSLNRALEIDPNHTEAHYKLGCVLRDQGRLGGAAICLRQALEINPALAKAYGGLGGVLRDLGQFDASVTSLRRALAISPTYPSAQTNLGAVLQDLGQLDSAATSLRRALVIEPALAEAYNNLGTVLRDLRQADGAATSLRRALVINPMLAETYSNLGTVLRDLGQLDGAVASLRRALVISPAYPSAHANFGAVLQDLGRLDGAATSLHRALAINPISSDAHANFASVLCELGQLDGAATSLRQTLVINPGLGETWSNLGTILRDIGQSDGAMTSQCRAIVIAPDNPKYQVASAMTALPITPQTVNSSFEAALKFGQSLQALRDWSKSHPAQRENLSEALCIAPPFFLAYRYGNHVELLSSHGDLASESSGQRRPISPRSPDRKLRLAVVSRNFHRHSVWDIILRGLLVNLDRQKFDIFLYHVGNSEDAETSFAKSLADTWRDAHTCFGFRSWRDAISKDQADVILYPEIGMDPITFRLASCRLAPLQVASWGHPISTGLQTIDLYFSGELIESPDADAHYRERLIRLPGTGCCTTPIDVSDEGGTELEERLAPCRGTLFVIAQAPFKFDPSDDALYADIAESVGASTFILLRHHRYPWATDLVLSRLRKAFSELGLIPEQHLLVVPWLARGQFYALLDRCDVYLDCPSFSGYTTAWQAVHRGIPVVTLEGEFMRQRLAAGLLRKIELTETIATSKEEYVSIAVRLAEECRDPTRRNSLRQTVKSAAPRADNDVLAVRAFERTLLDACERI